MSNLTSAYMSRYGYPIAEMEPTTLMVAGRAVIVGSIIWDEEYAAYRGIGHYAKKDGTAGHQIAKPLMFALEVPPAVRDALDRVRREHAS